MTGKRRSNGHREESIAQALSTGFSENQARPEDALQYFLDGDGQERRARDLG
jgi:hypothetical protein